MKLKPIKDKKKITAVFEKGKIINGRNISVRVYSFDGEEPGYVISVPKKSFPLAVKRNLIKRRLRAILSKRFFSEFGDGVSFFIIYNSKEVLSLSEIENDFKKIRTILGEWSKPSKI